MQCWTHFGAPLYPSYAWMCACINQLHQAKISLFMISEVYQANLAKVASILLQSFYQGYGFWWFQFN